MASVPRAAPRSGPLRLFLDSNVLTGGIIARWGLARPEAVAYPATTEILRSRHLIAHQSDIPILLSAIHARPHWLLTHNQKHFTAAVAIRSKLRIGSPAEFFRELAGAAG